MRAVAWFLALCVLRPCCQVDGSQPDIPAFKYIGLRWWFVFAGVVSLMRFRTDLKPLIHGQGQAGGEPLPVTAARIASMALVAPCTAVALAMRVRPSSTSYDPLTPVEEPGSEPPPAKRISED